MAKKSANKVDQVPDVKSKFRVPAESRGWSRGGRQILKQPEVRDLFGREEQSSGIPFNRYAEENGYSCHVWVDQTFADRKGTQ